MASKDQMRYRKTYSYYRVQPRTQELEIIADESLDWKHSVRAASTGDLSTTGATPLSVDGVTLAAGERVLLKDQGTGSQNGIYYVEISGGTYTLTRDTDAVQGTLTCGATTYVEEGTTQSGTIWILSTYNPLTVGSTTLTWTQFSGGGGGGGGGPSYWFSAGADAIYTTGSVGIGATVGPIGTDVYFYVSGSITGSGVNDKKAVFGGDVRMSGSLEVAGDQVEITGSLGVVGSVDVMGSVTVTGNMEVTGTFTATGGISGSLTALPDGTSYLVAGSNVTIVSQSNGSIEISSTGGGGGSSYWVEESFEKIYTTGSVGIGTVTGIDHKLVVYGGDALINDVSVGNGGYYDNIMIVKDTAVTSSATTRSLIIGYEAAKNSTGGYLNTVIGYWAGYSLEPGSAQNVFLGPSAGMNVTSGSINVALGSGALGQSRGSDSSVAIGSAALGVWNASIDGYRTSKNVAIGQVSLGQSLEGLRNTAVGWGAAALVETGDDNTVIGSEALYGKTSPYTIGSKNTVVGSRALLSASNSSENVAVGYQAGIITTTGNYNTFLGTQANASNASDSNSIVIGYGATGLGSNTTVIGNMTTTLTSIPSGSVGIGTTSVSAIGADVNVFVSGSRSDNNTGNKKAVFGGDVRISGSLAVGTGSVFITSNDIQFGSSGMRIQKNGNDMKFFDISNPSGLTLSELAAGGSSSPEYWMSPSAGVIYATGSVGIGTSSISSRLHVSGSGTGTTTTLTARHGVANGSSLPVLNVQNSAGDSLFYVSGSGFVGIGTSTASAITDVLKSLGGNVVSISGPSASSLLFEVNGNLSGSISTSNSGMIVVPGANRTLGLGSDNSVKLSIDTEGDINLQTSDRYFDASISSGQGIRLHSSPGNSDAQVLDAYYEADLSAVIDCSGNDGNGVYVLDVAYDTLKMTRVGRLVTIGGDLRIDSLGDTPSGRLYILLGTTSGQYPSMDTAASVYVTGAIDLSGAFASSIQAYVEASTDKMYIDGYLDGSKVDIATQVGAGVTIKISVTYAV